jgi:hypothetical protein
VLPLLAEWTDDEHAVLADLGYEGERAALTTPIEKTSDALLSDDQRTVNLLHAATRAPAERGNPLLETTSRALRRVSLCPWRIGTTTAALVLSTMSTTGSHDHREGGLLPGWRSQGPLTNPNSRRLPQLRHRRWVDPRVVGTWRSSPAHGGRCAADSSCAGIAAVGRRKLPTSARPHGRASPCPRHAD